MLAYDDFPVQSTILRERREGTLYITVPASEPDARVLYAARTWTALTAALRAVGTTAVVVLPFLGIISMFGGRVPPMADLLFLVLLLSMFLLYWTDLYQTQRHTLEVAWKRVTILAIRPDDIFIEQDSNGVWLPRRNLRDAVVVGTTVFSLRLPHLAITMSDGTIKLLEGRDISELRWIKDRLMEPPASGDVAHSE